MKAPAAPAVPPGRTPGFEHYTAGGRFNPAAPFSYFLATGVTRHLESLKALPNEGIHQYPHVLVAANEIGTPKELSTLAELVDQRAVLLDSGIFNLTITHARAHGMSMDTALSLPPEEIDGFEALYDRYCSLVTRFSDRLWGAIELDLGGPQVKPETRARIIGDTGVTPIPVVHPRTDGWDYYDAHAAAYDRVCVGNLVKAVGLDRIRLIHALSERSRRDHPDTWHHLLGVTPSQLTHAVPVRGSCDSSTWLNGVRWLKSWRTGAMASSFAHFPSDFWYLSARQSSSGESSYYRADGVALVTAESIAEGCRAVRKEYSL